MGPWFDPQLNFLWFDQLGCSRSPAHSADRITWKNQIDDIIAIIRKFGHGRPVNLIGHCLSSHQISDIVREDRSLVKSVTVYSPSYRISDIFKGVLRRSLAEHRLADLTEGEKEEVARFLARSDRDFGAPEVALFLKMAVRIRDLQELYWSNREAMMRYLGHMAIHPFAPEIFGSMQVDFFSHGVRPVPSFADIPTLLLHSEGDLVTPWASHGAELLKANPHAEVRTISDAFHWMHFERTEECVKLTLDFIRAQR